MSANTDNTVTPLPPAVEESLKNLNDGQAKWMKLSTSEKLQLLDDMLHICSKEVSLDKDFGAVGAWTAETLVGHDLTTLEGQERKTFEAIYPLILIKVTLEKLQEAYQMALGLSSDSVKKAYETNMKAQVHQPSGQVYLPVFPVTSADQMNLLSSGLTAQWFLDSTVVKKPSDAPRPFDLESQSDKVDKGVMVVLGAGNMGVLTAVDVLDALFCRQRTVLVKHHPLRGEGLDPLFRKVFRPLYEQHFMESCMDLKTIEANSALVYHPLVTALHMTGGKPTHDAIVWGSTKEEQETNKKNNTPKAEMTSELGCITPWIMSYDNNNNTQYTQKELKHHAEIMVHGLHNNASCNCLAPKAIIMAEGWTQKDEFMSLVKEEWNKLDLPVAYYPGCRSRWNKYRETYPNATEWKGTSHSDDATARKLSPPLLNNGQHAKEVVLLPMLCVDVSVDLSTKEGREQAKQEHAFLVEPFCPVVTFVTIKSDNFLESAVDLCNNYLFGTLSCSMTVPASLVDTPAVERAIANLHYGSIGVNCWTGMCYAFSWGGYPPTERLTNVQSGLGRIQNYKFVQHLVKSVVRAPPILATLPKPSNNYVQRKREFEAFGALVHKPGVVSMINLVFAAMLKIPPVAGWSVMLGAVSVGIGAVLVRAFV